MSEHHLYNGISGRKRIINTKKPFIDAVITQQINNSFREGKEEFLVDTGSDITLVPLTTAQEWGLILPAGKPRIIARTASGGDIEGFIIEGVMISLNTIYSGRCDLSVSEQVNHCILGVNFLYHFIFVYECNDVYSYSHFYHK